MNSLSEYLDFLPYKCKELVDKIRHESDDSISIFAGIHWVVHQPQVDAKLAKLIIGELNRILKSLRNSNYTTVTFQSMASLTLTPDECYEECFGTWEDYHKIKSLIPLLEIKLGRPIILRKPPNTKGAGSLLWQRLQQDSFFRRINNMTNGN